MQEQVEAKTPKPDEIRISKEQLLRDYIALSVYRRRMIDNLERNLAEVHAHIRLIVNEKKELQEQLDHGEERRLAQSEDYKLVLRQNENLAADMLRYQQELREQRQFNEVNLVLLDASLERESALKLKVRRLQREIRKLRKELGE
jgi:chromosome segregation ATPase